MAEATHLQEGPVRVTNTALVTPSGSWPLLAIGGARPVRVEPDVGWVQAIFVLAFVAVGIAIKRVLVGADHALPFFGAAAGLASLGLVAARRKRPIIALHIEHDGAQVEVWRSPDEAAVLRVVAAIEKARPQLVRTGAGGA